MKQYVNKYPLTIRISFLLLALILFFYAVIAAKDFLYPIVLGVLFGYLLYPAARLFEKIGIPRILSNLLSILLFLLFVGAGLFFIYKQVGGFIDDFPVYKIKALANIDRLESTIEKNFGVKNLRLVDFIRFRVRHLFDVGNTMVNKAFTNTAGTVFRLAILPVFMFLFLFYRTKLAIFILKLVPPENKRSAIWVLKEFASVVPSYMGGVSTVVLILAVINSTGLLIVGVDHAIVFGVISAICNFIPYFGTLIGGFFPVIFTLLTGDSFMLPARVIAFFAIVQFIENNILTPNIVGNSLRLNPMVIILGIIGGGMVWGIPGMFVIVPLLAMVNIIGEHFTKLQPFSYLLGIKGARKHSITIANIRRFFNRMKRR